MLFQVDTADPRPIYVQIVDEVRRGLATGTLRPHDPLPSVRDLAVTLRINPNTVQRAYRQMESEALVYVRRGKGTFVDEDAARPGDRERLAAEVARRAIVDAVRHGLTRAELVRAIQDAPATAHPTPAAETRAVEPQQGAGKA